LVADARAPTPSAAAELVVPDRVACLEALSRSGQRLAAGMRRELRMVSARLEAQAARLQRTHPGARLQQQMQRLDDLMQRLSGATRSALHRQGVRAAQLHGRLLHHSPRQRLSEQRAHTRQLGARLEQLTRAQLARAEARFALALRALHGVSPLATLDRGFAVVTGADGRLLTDAAAVPVGEEIAARLAHGTLAARVTGRKC